MVKKMISGFLALLLILCAFSPAAYADDEHQHTFGEVTDTVDTKGLKLPNGQDFPVNVSITKSPCSTPGISCGKVLYSWNFGGRGGSFVDDKDLPVAEVIKRWYEWNERFYGSNVGFTQFQAGGGSASPGGVGRNPSGYSGQGKPNINSNGICLLSCPITGVWEFYAGSSGYSISWISEDYFSNYTKDLPKKTFYAGGSDDVPEYGYIYCTFTAPVDGIYFFGNLVNGYSYCDFTLYRNFSSPISGSVTLNFSEDQPYNYVKHFNKGDIAYLKFGFDYHDHCDTSQISSSHPLTSLKFQFNPILLCVEPDPTDTSISNQTNITINNNTWNGNIYVDSSNKLTYIYPQYTVNNETKISNNPIIYNEETKQYYTYDSVTNNYYYITYGDPAPTPTPSPSPDPGGSGGGDNPSGGGSGGDGSGGGSGDTPSGSGSSWWDKLLSKIGDAIIDGLLGAVSAVLKLIFKLFSTILSWIIWAVSRVFDLLPFLPPGLGGLLVGGVVVCFVIGIIKFIRG